MRQFESHDITNQVVETRRAAFKFRPIMSFFIQMGLLKLLSTIAECPSTKPKSVYQALSINRLQAALQPKLWNAILTEFNMVCKAPQEPGIEICMALKLLSSLVTHLETIRDSLDPFEEVKQLVSSDYWKTRLIKRFFDEGKISSTNAVLSTREQFKIQTFFVIVDWLLQELKRR